MPWIISLSLIAESFSSLAIALVSLPENSPTRSGATLSNPPTIGTVRLPRLFCSKPKPSLKVEDVSLGARIRSTTKIVCWGTNKLL